jgi:CxxC-x17-CxxC domain-containing protein
VREREKIVYNLNPCVPIRGKYNTFNEDNLIIGGSNMGFQSGGGKYDNRPREMHKATCADCNKECEVPFKPSGDRPVYCKDCFSKRKDGGR